MTDARAISAQLVDIRNVGTHKVVKLTIHVPEEQALYVTKLFGWPTSAAPVPVALARLNEVPAPSSTVATSPIPDEAEPAERGRQIHNNKQEAQTSSAEQNSPQPGQEVRAGADKPKSPAQIAGYLCTLPSFHMFLQERFARDWDANYCNGVPEERAKQCIYDICTVTSRSQLTKDNMEWNALHLAFKLWEQHPELEDA